MDRKQNFRMNLAGIASKLTGENLLRLKFLCSDVIPAADNERVLTPEDLFRELEQTVSCPISGHFLQNCNILPHNSTNELKFSHSVASTAGK